MSKAAHQGWKELIIEYPLVVIFVGATALAAGVGIGSYHKDSWKEAHEIASKSNEKLKLDIVEAAVARDKARDALQPTADRADKLGKELLAANMQISTAKKTIEERDRVLVELEKVVEGKNQEIAAKNSEIATLKKRLGGPNPPPPPPLPAPKPEVTADTFVQYLYREGVACVGPLMTRFGVPNGFVLTQYDALRSSGFIEAAFDRSFLEKESSLNCVRLTASGRAYARTNGLD